MKFTECRMCEIVAAGPWQSTCCLEPFFWQWDLLFWQYQALDLYWATYLSLSDIPLDCPCRKQPMTGTQTIYSLYNAVYLIHTSLFTEYIPTHDLASHCLAHNCCSSSRASAIIHTVHLGLPYKVCTYSLKINFIIAPKWTSKTNRSVLNVGI